MCSYCTRQKAQAKELAYMRTMANLRMENVDLQDKVTELQSKLVKFQKTRYKGPKYLKKLPIELRTKIFELLLVNPQLGEPLWLGSDTNYGREFKYGLSPQILMTCRWIREEATPILYQQNTFVLITNGKTTYEPSRLFPTTPLSRHIGTCIHHASRFRLEDLGGFDKIRRWLVLERNNNHTSVSATFVDFCQSIRPKGMFSLEVLIIFNAATSRPNLSSTSTANDSAVKTTSAVLEALSVVRGAEDIKIRPAKATDLAPSMIKKMELQFLEVLPVAQNQVTATRRLVMGNTKVERVGDMYALLLTYAQSFEISGEYAADMGHMAHPHATSHPALSFRNPHRGPFQHWDAENSVEMSLDRARTAMAENNAEVFRKHRQTLMVILEPQFQRIMKGYQSLRDLVESNKSLLDFETEDEDEDDWMFLELSTCEKALSMAVAQVEAFERDIPPHVASLMRRIPLYRIQKLSFRYDALDFIKTVLDSMTIDEDHFELRHEFRGSFQELVKSLEGQYFDVIESRRSLLKSDLPERACKIDLRIDLPDDPIEWSNTHTDSDSHSHDEDV